MTDQEIIRKVHDELINCMVGRVVYSVLERDGLIRFFNVKDAEVGRVQCDALAGVITEKEWKITSNLKITIPSETRETTLNYDSREQP